jgi:tyrosine-protein kinase Etk/Wzc
MTNAKTENQDLNSGMQEENNEIGILDILKTVVDNLRLLFFGPLITGILALGYGFMIPATYTAKTQFIPPQQQQSAAASLLASLGGLGGVAGASNGIKNPADQYLAYLKSISIQDSLIERFQLLDLYKAKTKAEARQILRSKLRTGYSKEGLIFVEVDDLDPRFSAELANAYVEELGKLLGRIATTEAQQRRFFLEKQLVITKEKFFQAELALKATGISGNVLKSNPSAAVVTVAGLQERIVAQEVKLGAMRGYLVETAPEFKQALFELNKLREQLYKQEKDSPASKNFSTEGDYISKYREFKYQENMLELFTKQLELAKLDEAKETAFIQVLDLAEPPEIRSKPKKTIIILITILITIIFLMCFIFTKLALTKLFENSEFTTKIIGLNNSWKNAIGRS